MSIKLRLIVFLSSLLISLYSGQDESLFVPIQSYLERFRHSIEKNDLTVESDMIYLKLYSRRTTYKTILLLGFHSVGRALQKSSISFSRVQVNIHYEMKESQQISATASIESVLALSRGQMNPDQFFSKVRY